MQFDSWMPITQGRLIGQWCLVELAPDGDGFCVIVRRRPTPDGELSFSDWHPTYEALHSAFRDYDWEVEWPDTNPQSTQH